MEEKLLQSIRRRLGVFILALVISGLTAFPLETEAAWANRFLDWLQINNSFARWIRTVYAGISHTGRLYPFINYGTDWLAFGHLVIALFFVGPLIDPVRNRWVIIAGLIACAMVFPLAFTMGHFRGIPFFWQCIDCSFGLVGGWLLFSILRKTQLLEKARIGRTGYKPTDFHYQKA